MPTTSDWPNADSTRNEPTADPDELTLLTAGEVAAMLKVSKSWVYEHTRARGARGSGLPFVKIGKYVRFDARLVREFVRIRTRRA